MALHHVTLGSHGSWMRPIDHHDSRLMSPPIGGGLNHSAEQRPVRLHRSRFRLAIILAATPRHCTELAPQQPCKGDVCAGGVWSHQPATSIRLGWGNAVNHAKPCSLSQSEAHKRPTHSHAHGNCAAHGATHLLLRELMLLLLPMKQISCPRRRSTRSPQLAGSAMHMRASAASRHLDDARPMRPCNI